MNKKMLVVSILAAAIMILLPISSVVGTNVVKSHNEERAIGSPLFAVQQRSKNKISSEYLGKGKVLNLFLSRRSSLQSLADRALKIIEARPGIIKTLMDKVTSIPEVVSLLEENGISIDDFKNQMNLIMNDPVLLKEKTDDAVLLSPFGDDPMPLGLSTSSALGCFIIALILIPLFAVIGMIIATITIITCLNINGCFETLVQNLVDSFVQGLVQPD